MITPESRHHPPASLHACCRAIGCAWSLGCASPPLPRHCHATVCQPACTWVCPIPKRPCKQQAEEAGEARPSAQDALSIADEIRKEEKQKDGLTFYDFDIDSPVRTRGRVEAGAREWVGCPAGDLSVFKSYSKFESNSYYYGSSRAPSSTTLCTVQRADPKPPCSAVSTLCTMRRADPGAKPPCSPPPLAGQPLPGLHQRQTGQGVRAVRQVARKRECAGVRCAPPGWWGRSAATVPPLCWCASIIVQPSQPPPAPAPTVQRSAMGPAQQCSAIAQQWGQLPPPRSHNHLRSQHTCTASSPQDFKKNEGELRHIIDSFKCVLGLAWWGVVCAGLLAPCYGRH